jgi:hypothetical protein
VQIIDGGASTVDYITLKGAPTNGGTQTNTSPVIATAGSDTNINLTFAPKGSGNTIFSSGNVGIGTTSPGTTLQVGGASAATLEIGNSSVNVQSNVFVGGYMASNGYAAYSANWTNSNMWGIGNTGSSTDNTVRIGIINGGTTNGTWAGTGTANDVNLEVASVRGANASGSNHVGGNFIVQAGLATGNAASGNILFNGGVAGSSGSALESSTTYMTIVGGGTSAGSVGIGTTSPSNPLSIVSNSSTNDEIAVQNTNAAGSSGLVFIDNLGAIQGAFGYVNASAPVGAGTVSFGAVGTTPLAFVTASTSERMRITSTGNVGIGTMSPSAQLEVSGQIRSIAYNAGASTTINWNNGNNQYTAPSGNTCTVFTLNNMLNGGSYTLAVQGVTSGTCTFSATGLTFVYSPVNTPVTTDAVYTFLVMGTKVYVSWVTGFQ